MNLLIIGGTRFLGRSLVDAALQKGHEVTLFNRGQTNPGLFPGVETIVGDRKTDLSVLAEAARQRRWNSVIDTCGYLPKDVRAAAELLAPAVDTYTFISSISVYKSFKAGPDENSPVEPMPRGVDPDTADIMQNYGALKALCEQAAESALPGRTLVIRPGLIVGPHDPTDRFTYWPYRAAQGGEMLAPMPPEQPVQFIDVRDLAEWNIRMVEAAATGVYNATGPAEPLSFSALLETCTAAGAEQGSLTAITWVAEDFLIARKVEPWMEIPLWIPGPDSVGMNSSKIQRALSAGLTFRSLADTVSDTLAWALARSTNHSWKAGLSREREAELLKEWHEMTD